MSVRFLHRGVRLLLAGRSRLPNRRRSQAVSCPRIPRLPSRAGTEPAGRCAASCGRSGAAAVRLRERRLPAVAASRGTREREKGGTQGAMAAPCAAPADGRAPLVLLAGGAHCRRRLGRRTTERRLPSRWTPSTRALCRPKPPLQRDSPRAALETFLDAIRSGDFLRAAHVLPISGAFPPPGPGGGGPAARPHARLRPASLTTSSTGRRSPTSRTRAVIPGLEQPISPYSRRSVPLGEVVLEGRPRSSVQSSLLKSQCE